MARGLTLDTGALIALERRRVGMTRRIRAAILAQDRVTVPSPVIAEWWQGGQRQRLFQNLFRPKALVVEPTSFEVAKLAGEAIAKTGATAVDAIVMAGAAQRGDAVFTSDLDDLEALRRAAIARELIHSIALTEHEVRRLASIQRPYLKPRLAEVLTFPRR